MENTGLCGNPLGRGWAAWGGGGAGHGVKVTAANHGPRCPSPSPVPSRSAGDPGCSFILTPKVVVVVVVTGWKGALSYTGNQVHV
ncbi:hypothetical protein E2C01_099195 [Portunus trituberculatus]|uniref:Uncharacterized protein n=1 Tax=Portunus trituberculatus TaxID=210409 RepID=A0A5B7KA77_PORTR|nr:hypothetical protein [Portunus trituberculatus]